MNRAYSILNIKAVSENERVIEGIASTPTPDRMGDIVEPLGAKFKLPMPLLWQHRSDQPVGHVEFAKPNKDGIPFKARIATIDEPGELKNLLDKAWQAVKAKLVGAVSIGFTINAFEILKEGGWRITDWEWLELSLVTIPANAEATISSVKSIDAPLLAASGFAQRGTERTVKAGVTASRSTHVVKATEAKQTMKKTIAEQIAGFEAARQVKATRMTEIMDAAAEKGETLDQAEQTEYEDLKADLKSIDDHLGRLKEMESLNLTKAIVVDNGHRLHPLRDRPGSRQGQHHAGGRDRQVQPALEGRDPRGRARAQDRGDPGRHVGHWLVERSGELSDPHQRVHRVSAPAHHHRPHSGPHHVPFNVKIGRQTGAATVNWVGQGAPKPLTSLAFDTVTLDLAKIAGIIVLNDELVKISNPAAEALVQSDLAKAIVQFMDSQFVDPTKAATSGVSPASITNGVTAIIPTGTTGAAFRADMKTLLGQFLSNNMQVNGTVLLMPQRLALGISLMTNSLGQREFPNLTMNGGEILGLPVITSEGIPSTGGSPTDGDPIIAVSAPDILLADDGVVTIDASREASLQMDSAPDSPATASTIMVSMFQQNQVAIRAERYINWAKRRSTAVSYISNAKYFE
jgi:HK97 family phage major capsid protein/HK97 family phage prohead protease